MYTKGGFPMTFEWDERKNRINKAKHAVSFEQAAKVWKDPKRIVFYDEKHSTDEERWIVLGVSGVVLLLYSWRKQRKTFD